MAPSTLQLAAPAPETAPGLPHPLGATAVPDGINFAVASSTAAGLRLVLLDPDDGTVLTEIAFPAEHRIGAVFTMTVRGLDPRRCHYGYRVQDAQGRLSPVILDPYARSLAGAGSWGERPQYRSAVLEDTFDWTGDRHPRIPHSELVIYETHVRGYTHHPSSGVTHPGTYAGLIEKIPHLQRLGVNCVELLPVFAFDETDNTYTSPDTGLPLRNFWGYNSVGFFAPTPGYATDSSPARAPRELKQLIKSLHRAGIEVVLDVVFNHTAEGDRRGPTLSFRALDEAAYYRIGPDGQYVNLTATGNTVNCNHPLTRAFILDCLRYWATEYRVDGFRFDMASILARGTDGALLPNPPLLEAIAHDPVLAHCKLIAEATDAAGSYQVGSFPGYHRWAEWNMRYRDAIRRLLLARPGSAAAFAPRLIGSPDLYPGRGAAPSVNYITCHDGLTLADWTAYDRRHNEANGEGGHDGIPDEDSWNCGHEGPTDDPAVLRLRHRMATTALLLLFASQGVPMLLAGDEFGRTQGGNNNTYCQDSALSWVDWNHRQSHAGLLEFTRRCLAFRRAHPALHRLTHADSAPRPGHCYPPVSWHGTAPWQPDWSESSTLVAAVLYEHAAVPDCVYLAVNTGDADREVQLPPPPPGTGWHLFADTARTPDSAAHEPGDEPRLSSDHHTLGAHCALLVTAKPLAQPHRDRRRSASGSRSARPLRDDGHRTVQAGQPEPRLQGR
ncbi:MULTISPECIES: glycogen debranching protein [unclassified Streptomyces]|uniref:glycogen debranching protein n=1 Tax=unclassified Streptomyces TaxID=2593676 RepID=UPI0037F56DD0